MSERSGFRLSKDALDTLVLVGAFGVFAFVFWVASFFFAPIGLSRTVFLFLMIAVLFACVWGMLKVRRAVQARFGPPPDPSA
jgi:hypothetical protein